MQGKKILDFVMPSGGDDILYKPATGGSISTVEDNYGDHGVAWAVRYDANGNEIDRFNLRYVSIITWAN